MSVSGAGCATGVGRGGDDACGDPGHRGERRGDDERDGDRRHREKVAVRPLRVEERRDQPPEPGDEHRAADEEENLPRGRGERLEEVGGVAREEECPGDDSGGRAGKEGGDEPCAPGGGARACRKEPGEEEDQQDRDERLRDPHPQKALVVGGQGAPAPRERSHHPGDGRPGKESGADRDGGDPPPRHRRRRLSLHHSGRWGAGLYTVSVPAVYSRAPVFPEAG
ncbi:hypothetical protein [Methanoculleus formosensis]|uniref:hypothetical protein n=1 Tax=Methanoculleus formosensis TaxID=2590886 RepID=UPI0021C1985A|nr:hypothetical protein [Methanoculleus sp. Afa-1]